VFLPPEAVNKPPAAEESAMTLSFMPDARNLQEISVLPTESALQEGAGFLANLVMDPAFLYAWILPLLAETGGKESWYVAHRYDDQDSSCSLQIFVWPPGTRTRIHDHTSWGAFCCALGSLVEERYERLDDASRSDFARLKKVRQLSCTREDGSSTVLPYEGGIHRVGNSNKETAISVHLYGPRVGEVDGRDYDPSRDYVCDRRGD
jgi:predicted metal-dependent enzyme (double-stranded beta helix superfamily)